MKNMSKAPPIDYVYHMLNSSPSKSAYTFTKQVRFKTDSSPSNDNSNYSPIKSSIHETNPNRAQRSDMFSMNRESISMNKDRSKEQPKKQNRELQQKDDYYGYETKTNKKKDQYTIFPVRKSIDELVKEMQELRFIFKSGFKQKKFMSSQRKDTQKQNKRDSYNTYKAEKDTSRYSPRTSTLQRSKSAIDSARFSTKRTDSHGDVRDVQADRRRSISSFSNYIQSKFCNSSSFSFAKSPRRLFNSTVTQGDRKFDFYSPFSEFGPNKQWLSKAY